MESQSSMEVTFLVIGMLTLIVGIVAAAPGVEVIGRWVRHFAPRLIGLRDSLFDFLSRLTKISQYQLTWLALIVAVAGLGLAIYGAIALAAGNGGNGALVQGPASTPPASPASAVETATSLSPTLTPMPSAVPATPSGGGKISGRWYSYLCCFWAERFYGGSSVSYLFTLEEASEGVERYRWGKSRAAISFSGRETIGAGTATLDGGSLHMEGTTTNGRFEAEFELLADGNAMDGASKSYLQSGSVSETTLTLVLWE